MIRGSGRLALILSLAAGSWPAASGAQTVREKAEIQVVTVRVTARDHSGKPVEDLAAEDLTLSIDGRKVAIDTLSRETRASNAGSSTPAVASAAAAPVATVSAKPAPAPPSAARQMALFLDESEAKSFDRRDVDDQLTKFLEQPGAAPRRLLLARFDGSRLVVESPWSDSAAGALDAIARIRRHPTAERLSGASDLMGTSTSLEELEANGSRLCRALLETLALFPPEGGERQLVFSTGGTALMHPKDVADYLDQERHAAEQTALPRSPQFEQFDAKRQPERDTSAFTLWSRSVNPGHVGLTMRDVTAKAVELDVALVPIAAEPPDRDRRNVPGAFADSRTHDSGVSGSPTGTTPVGTLTPSYRLGVAQEMSTVASDTGGEPILLPGKAASRLAEIGDRAAYELTFRDPISDQQLHRIELACRRAGVTLEYRRGYRIATEEDRALDAVVARLVDRNRPGDPAVTASLSDPHAEGRKLTRVTVRVTPPRESQAVEERSLKLVAVGENAGGDRTEPVHWNATARATDAPGVYEAVTDLGVPYGAYFWSIAVTDVATGLTVYAFAAPP